MLYAARQLMPPPAWQQQQEQQQQEQHAQPPRRLLVRKSMHAQAQQLQKRQQEQQQKQQQPIPSKQPRVLQQPQQKPIQQEHVAPPIRSGPMNTLMRAKRIPPILGVEGKPISSPRKWVSTGRFVERLNPSGDVQDGSRSQGRAQGQRRRRAGPDQPSR